MSEAIPDDIARALAARDRHAYLEQRLFVLSPVGAVPTVLIVFVAFAGTLAIAWSVSGRPFVTHSGDKLIIGSMIWLGLWFTLMIATVLGMQRYARVKDREDAPRYAKILRGGWDSASQMSELTPSNAPLGRATVIGLALGLAGSWLFYVANSSERLTAYPALLVWFFVVTTILITSFCRGVALTRAGSAAMKRRIDEELIIDLLRIDGLTVVGRSAARPAIVWFTISAAIFLIFIGGGITAFSLVLLAGCAVMGLWVFVATMEQVHRKILAAKAAELERLRREIEAFRARCAHEAEASVKLQGLLAYEARIMAAQEWPFDQTTAVRVGASALILTVPWFGQAAAAYLVEHASHVAG